MAEHIDTGFKALASPTRRRVVNRLAYGPATTSALAAAVDVSVAAMFQILQQLEAAGLVVSHRVGRTRMHELNPDGLRQLESWLASQRDRWDAQLDRLARMVDARKGTDDHPDPQA